MNKVSSKRTDLLLDWGVQTVQVRKEELVQKQATAQNTIDSLKREISIGEREMKGISLFENNHVTIHDEECSTVLSENGGKEYLVNKKNGTCQCKDHEFTGKYGVICKHRIADKLSREEQDEPYNEQYNVVTFASMEVAN